MKKILFIAIAALLACQCVREMREDAGLASGRKSIVFEGYGSSDSKITLGGLEDGAYKLLWSRGDAIGIFSIDRKETANKNIRASLYESSENENKGIFIPEDRIIEIPSEIEGGDPVQVVEKLSYPENEDEKFLVYYPYSGSASLDQQEGGQAQTIHSSISHLQKQATLGDGKIGENGFCTAIATVKAGSDKATFTLEHRMAYIRFKAKPSQLPGYQLHSVQLCDTTHKAVLSGNFVYEATGDTLSLDTLKVKRYSDAKISAISHDWNSDPQESELILTVLPGDYSESDMLVIVTFINEAGESETIPMKFNKRCVFPASTLTTVDLGNIGPEQNVVPWFETHEVRGLVDYYAYGSENTYLAEHHKRPADDPNARPKSHVVIDVKPRGDFSRVKEPKYYALVSPSEMGCTSIKSNARKLLCLTADGKDIKIQAVPTYTVKEDYTIEVWVMDTTAGTGTWGVVGIYDEDYNLLWSYLIVTWLQGHPVNDITYGPGMTVMDRWLGQELGNAFCASIGTFVPNYASDSTRKNSGVLPFFQWGRKDAFPWSNSDGCEGIYKAVVANDATIIESGIKNPTTHFGYSSGAASYDSHGDWHNEGVRHDLWGGVNNTSGEWCDPDAVGHKTIFDPCPAGYRIPDAKVLKYVGDNAEIWETENSSAFQITDTTSAECYIKRDSPFYGKYSVLAVKDVNGEYDYWYFAGYGSNSGSNFNSRSGNTKNNALETWCNAPSNADNRSYGRAAVLEYGYWSKERLFNVRHSAQRSYRYPVRCQKIEQ